MSDYGIQPTGFVRKPLSVILAEIEAAMITEFGPDVIQTSQSPFGQLNGLFADLVNEVWEEAEDLYQSYDPDQAEGIRLDTLAKIRLLSRGDDTDEQFRKAITNQDQARVDLQDVSRAIAGLDGVIFHQAFVNETGEIDNYGLERGTMAVAVIGGNDEDIAKSLRRYVAPGINTYGNHVVTSNIDGYCRSMNIIRPNIIDIELELIVKSNSDRQGCPPPSPTAIIDSLINDWNSIRINGLDITHFSLRSLIESRFPNIELINFIGRRNDIDQESNQKVDISFIEIGNLLSNNITVTVI